MRRIFPMVQLHELRVRKGLWAINLKIDMAEFPLGAMTGILK